MIGLVGWIALCALAASRHAMLSWHYFATAGQTLLTPPGGLHVYGEHPELQFGPLTMAVCALLGLAPSTAAAVIACVMMLVLGLAAIAILGRLSAGHHGGRVSTRTAMLYVALLAPLWLVLAVHYGHLDDALALFFMAAAVAQGKRDRWLTAALLLAAASGAKPWVVPMAMILLAAPRPARLKAFTIFVVGTALPWIPFVLADSRTMQLSRFVIDVADDSVLRQIGSLSVATPTWVRPTQFLIGAALAIWLARRGRWVCVPFAVLSVRLLTDPQTYLYYSTGLAVAAAIADLTRNDRRPILTGLVVGWSAVTMLLATPGQLTGAGTVRLVGLLAGIVVVIVDDGWSPAAARRNITRDDARTTVTVQRHTQHVVPARPAVTATAPDLVAPTTPSVGNAPRVDEHPTVTTFTMEKLPDPPKLGELWTRTRRPLRPSASSRLIRR
ncbi:hypothetical protein GCM10011492_43690 [Flexivirga endophytica]|uniref:Uncharacterized protein n=2 Tax=Flexivirga endophytica TaxID=1849103 RepID=A0A916X0M8_9MICO|nr:hypothetical protein [Flexivirga endophytica]GGB47763.1 hypothetical protein GCM10011492_43690 [Flexivirga endophytica]GHB60704.1 hypothetical protein GCM10008112_32080 [Flexivirga endophytica]